MPKLVGQVDTHPKKDQIIAELLKATPAAQIAAKYKVSRSAIYRYRAEKLTEKLAEELKKKDEHDQNYIIKQLDALIERSWKYADAVDEELRDPDDRSKYFLGPQARDIEVVYLTKTGKRRKATLQKLLRRAEKAEGVVTAVEYKIADPRVLHIRNQEALTKSIVALGKLTGNIQSIEVNVTHTEEWSIIKQIIIQATATHPEIRENIIAELKQVDR